MITTTPVRRGFTLIELLVVIGIISVLIGVSLAIGPRVLDGQRTSATKNVLASLDRMLDEVVDSAGGVPPYNPFDYAGVPGARLGPRPDSPPTGPEEFGESDSEHVRFPAAGVFVNQAQGVGQADAILAGIAPKFIVTTQRDAPLETGPGEPGSEEGVEPFIPNILDAWATRTEWDSPWPQLGNTLVLYVHPRNLLAQRLYGRCVNDRPYFMSAGADRLYGSTAQISRRGGVTTQLGETDANLVPAAVAALADNIYSYQPQPADTSAAFNNESR